MGTCISIGKLLLWGNLHYTGIGDAPIGDFWDFEESLEIQLFFLKISENFANFPKFCSRGNSHDMYMDVHKRKDILECNCDAFLGLRRLDRPG